jgi:thioredoxin reductase
MKVAIMGAGLYGLSCAIALEKNSISPFIFERRSSVVFIYGNFRNANVNGMPRAGFEICGKYYRFALFFCSLKKTRIVATTGSGMGDSDGSASSGRNRQGEA